MSQVLEKPILLDETGQSIAGKLDTNGAAIVGKLNDIKEAVTSSTEFVPVKIQVTTPPVNTNYYSGETLDLSRMVVSVIGTNGVYIDITSQCMFSPADGTVLTSADTEVSISYYWYKDNVTFTTSQPLTVKELSSIAITTPPTQTEYYQGDTLDLTGIAVTATFDNGDTRDVTAFCTFNPADGDTLVAGTTGVVASYTAGSVTKTATQSIVIKVPAYGVEWDGTATTAWTRTDKAANFTDPVPYYSGMSETPSSPFDNISPWKDMAVVSDSTAGVLVSIPKFYYKLTQTGAKLKIQISSEPSEGFSTSPAHMDRGDGNGERDVIYVGRYHCQQDYASGNVSQPATGNKSYLRSRIHSKGADIWQMDFATRFTIWLLYLVEFADWDSQAKIGYGCGGGSSTSVCGYTDSMPYHTGTTQSSKTTYGFGTQYRHIEGLWDNIADYLDGCYSNANGFNIILSPSSFSDTTGGVSVGTPSHGYPTAFTVSNVNGAFPLFIATEANNGSGTTYSSDIWAFGSSDPVSSAGGGTSQQLNSGLFAIYRGGTTNSGGGCRLMKLPANS